MVSHGGQSFRARLCDLGRGPIAFNAQGLQHAVMPFKGRRLVLIAYYLKNVASLDRASCRALRALGFRLPAKEPPPRTLPAVVTGFPDLRLSGCSSPSPSGHPASPGPALQEAAASEGPPGPSTAISDSEALPAVRAQNYCSSSYAVGPLASPRRSKPWGFRSWLSTILATAMFPWCIVCILTYAWSLRGATFAGLCRPNRSFSFTLRLPVARPRGHAKSRSKSSHLRPPFAAKPSLRGCPAFLPRGRPRSTLLTRYTVGLRVSVLGCLRRRPIHVVAA